MLFVSFVGSNPRTDLDPSAILNQDFDDFARVKLKLPARLNPAKRITVQYHDEDNQPVELTIVASQKIDGQLTHLLAVRPIFEGQELDGFEMSGTIEGSLHKDNFLGHSDIARIEKLFPGLNFSHCILLDTGNYGVISMFWLLFLLFGAGLVLTSLKTFRHLISDYQAAKFWRHERQTNPDLQDNFDATIEAGLISSEFKLPNMEPPRTSRVISSSIYLVQGAIVCFASAAFTIGIKQPAANAWFMLGALIALVGLACVNGNLMKLADALKPINKLIPSRKNRFTRTEFHRYHKQVLRSFGFTSIGLFKLKDKRFELFQSSDGSMVAELSHILCDNTIDQHSCELTSVFTNTMILTTSTLDSNEEAEPIEPEIFLANTLAKHIDAVDQYCDKHSVELMPIYEHNTSSLFQLRQITQRHLAQQQVQESAVNFLKGWKWTPEWFRWPVVNWDTANGYRAK